MNKLLGWAVASAMGATIVTATPVMAFQGGSFGGGHGSGFGGTGGMQMGRQAFVGRFHNPAVFPHHRHIRNLVVIGGPAFYYNGAYNGNNCWQHVWTPYGWHWNYVCDDDGD